MYFDKRAGYKNFMVVWKNYSDLDQFISLLITLVNSTYLSVKILCRSDTGGLVGNLQGWPALLLPMK